MPRTFSESRRHIKVYIVVIILTLSSGLYVRKFEDTEVRVSVAVDYILHHDFLVDKFD